MFSFFPSKYIFHDIFNDSVVEKNLLKSIPENFKEAASLFLLNINQKVIMIFQKKKIQTIPLRG